MSMTHFCTFDTCDSPQFACNFIEPRRASGWASGFSTASGRVGRQVTSGRVFPPSLHSLILTQVKIPFGGEIKKEEEMNKRLILAWKTLAHCEPDGWGKVPRFESSVGGFYADQERLEKCGRQRPGFGTIAQNDWTHFFNNPWHCEGIILRNSVIKHNLKSF